jgi:anti-sigma regulatory factor (Ser/Thr protein kinase)
MLSEWRLGYLAADAALLVTELMTNAVQASKRSGTPVCLRLLADRDQVVIEVWDRNPGKPERRLASYEDEHGRGLSVIQALSYQWGCYFSGGWKVVWAELRLPAPSQDR